MHIAFHARLVYTAIQLTGADYSQCHTTASRTTTEEIRFYAHASFLEMIANISWVYIAPNYMKSLNTALNMSIDS